MSRSWRGESADLKRRRRHAKDTAARIAKEAALKKKTKAFRRETCTYPCHHGQGATHPGQPCACKRPL